MHALHYPLILVAAAVATARAEVDCIFSAWLEASSLPVVSGKEGWLYLTAELRFLTVGDFWGDAAADAGRAQNPAHRDPLEPIDDFNRQLADRGIRLLVVPVPPKALVHPVPLGCDPQVRETHRARLRRFYDFLRERGVAVLDLTDDYIAMADAGEPVYCRTDTHWAGSGIRVAAQRIADWLMDNGLVQPVSSSVETIARWRLVERELEIVGDLCRLQGASERERLALSFPEDANGQPPRISSDSPVLLLGDSHVLVFHEGGDLHAAGAGLPDLLAARLNQPVDVLGVRGSGATTSRISLIRRIRAQVDFFNRKKAIIWVFAAREFTEADAWRFVPLPVQ